MNASDTDKIKRLCAEAGQPGKAAVFIAAGWYPARVEATLKREGKAGSQEASANGAGASLASMRREIARAGMTTNSVSS